MLGIPPSLSQPNLKLSVFVFVFTSVFVSLFVIVVVFLFVFAFVFLYLQCFCLCLYCICVCLHVIFAGAATCPKSSLDTLLVVEAAISEPSVGITVSIAVSITVSITCWQAWTIKATPDGVLSVALCWLASLRGHVKTFKPLPV